MLSLPDMRKFAVVLLVLTLSLCSCAERSSSPAALSEEKLAAFRTAPSDALALVYCDSPKNLGILPSPSSKLSKLDLSGLEAYTCLVSYCFQGKLVPVMSLCPVSAKADVASDFAVLKQRAASSGLFSELIPSSFALQAGKDVMLVSESQSLLTACKRHLSEGHSILDAQDFSSALEQSSGSGAFIILRNSGAARFTPKGLFSEAFTFRNLTRILNRCSEWTILLCAQSAGSYEVKFARPEGRVYLSDLMEGLPPAESRLGAVLPVGTEFAVSLSAPCTDFRSGYEKYLDAGAGLTKYRRKLNELKADSGKDPLKWEKELDVKEVALVQENGRKVLLVRGRECPDSAPAENPYRGFIPALYGETFSLEDDSFHASALGWHIYGSEKAVRSFALCEEREEDLKWPTRDSHIIFYRTGSFLVWDKKGLKIWNSNQ